MTQIYQHLTATYGKHFRETLKLAWPVVIGLMGFNLMGLIDSLMIGDLSYVHLSAAALANGMFIILTIIGMGLSFVLSPLVAEADASGQSQRVGDMLRQGTLVMLVAGVILSILVYFSSFTLEWLDQPEQDVVLAKTYLQILSISTMPLLIFMVFKQFSDGLSLTRPAMYVTLLGLVINAGANWVLIYGKFGFPRMELDGAGWGTLVSRIVMMIVLGIYVLSSKKFEAYQLKRGWTLVKPKIMRRIAQLGIPSGFQHFFEAAAFVGRTVIIGWMADPSANRAAHQIVLQLATVSFMVVLGISAASTIRVGNALGHKDPIAMRQAGVAGVMLATTFMSMSALIFLFGKDFFPVFFNDNARVLAISAQLMLIAGLFQIFDGIQVVGIGILRGIQDVKVPTAITFLAYWVINLPLGYVLGITFDWGVRGIWFAFVVSLGVAAVLLSYRFWSLTEKMKIEGVRPRFIQADPKEIPQISHAKSLSEEVVRH